MKTFFIVLISILLIVIIGILFFPIFYHPNFIEAIKLSSYYFHYGLLQLFSISFAFILCGWLAWQLYKIKIYEMTLKEKENETDREVTRQIELAAAADKRLVHEIERNRVNDLLRIAQVSKDKVETDTSVTNTTKLKEGKGTEKIQTDTNKVTNEEINFEKFSNIFQQYQTIISQPNNE
jgi:hypothetical protein